MSEDEDEKKVEDEARANVSQIIHKHETHEDSDCTAMSAGQDYEGGHERASPLRNAEVETAARTSMEQAPSSRDGNVVSAEVSGSPTSSSRGHKTVPSVLEFFGGWNRRTNSNNESSRCDNGRNAPSDTGNGDDTLADDRIEEEDIRSDEPVPKIQTAEERQEMQEMLPSRRGITVPQTYKPSQTATAEVGKLKKMYSFVEVDSINMEMGRMPMTESFQPSREEMSLSPLYEDKDDEEKRKHQEDEMEHDDEEAHVERDTVTMEPINASTGSNEDKTQHDTKNVPATANNEAVASNGVVPARTGAIGDNGHLPSSPGIVEGGRTTNDTSPLQPKTDADIDTLERGQQSTPPHRNIETTLHRLDSDGLEAVPSTAPGHEQQKSTDMATPSDGAGRGATPRLRQRRRTSLLQLRHVKQLVAKREDLKSSLLTMRKKRQRLARAATESAFAFGFEQAKRCEFVRENFGPFLVCTPVYDNEDEENTGEGNATGYTNSSPIARKGNRNASRSNKSSPTSSPEQQHHHHHQPQQQRDTRGTSDGHHTRPHTDESSSTDAHSSHVMPGTPRGLQSKRASIIEEGSGMNDIIQGKRRDASEFEKSLSKMKAKIQIKTPTTIDGLVHPECELKITWDLIVGVGVLYTLVIVPYQLSFLTTEDDIALLSVNVACDVLFAFDIFIKMNTAERDKRGDLITDKAKVVSDYVFRGLFLLDVISCIPIDLILYFATSGDDSDDYRALRYLKLLRLARLARLIRCFKIANINLVLESFGKISMNPAMGRLFQFVIGFLCVTHVMACLWWAVGDRNSVSWETGQPHSWAVDYTNKSSSYKYIISLYWAMGTMSGVGYGDVLPLNTQERLFAILAELVGVFAFGLVVGYVSTLVESVSYKNSVHRERHLKMSSYIKQRNLPGNLQKRLNEHVKWSVRNQSVFDEKEILHDFPVSLQQEVMLHSNQHLISTFPVLQSTTSGFLLLVTSAMRAAMYSKGDTICREGELGKCMYFVASGQTCAWVKKSLSSNKQTTEEMPAREANTFEKLVSKLQIITEKNSSTDSDADTKNSVRHLSQYTVGFCFCGDHFGEAELLDTSNQFRYLSWDAFSNTEIHTLDKETLRRLQKMYSKEYNNLVIESIATQELYTAAIDSLAKCDGNPKLCKIVLSKELIPVPRLPKKAFDKVCASFDRRDDDAVSTRRESRGRQSNALFTGGLLSHFGHSVGRGLKHMAGKKSREDRKPPAGLSDEDAELLKITAYYDSLFEESARQTNTNSLSSRARPPREIRRASFSTGDGIGVSNHRAKWITDMDDDQSQQSPESGERTLRFLGTLWPLLPTDKFRLCWDLLLGLIILYNIITVPIRIAFDMQLSLEDKSFRSVLITSIEVAFDFMFMIDIVLNFLTAYYKVDGELVTDFQSIAIKYIRTWLLLDIVASIPFDFILILAQDGSSSGGVFSSVKMLKTLRVARALKLFRARRLLALLNELEDHLGVSSSAFTMLKLGFEISLAGHLMGCVFYYVSDKQWLHDVELNIDSDVWDRYIASLYWAFTTMTTVGYGDIVFESEKGYLYGIFSMLVGSLIFSFVIGNFSTMTMQMNRSALQFQKKMDKLNEYMHERNLPHRLRHLCRRYLLDMNLNLMAMDEQYILDELPDSLASEIMLFVHSDAIERMAIFDGLEASVVTHIISIMKQQIFLPYQYLIVAGQRGYGVIFIITGEVQLFRLHGTEEIPLSVYGQGSFISEALTGQVKTDPSSTTNAQAETGANPDGSSKPQLSSSKTREIIARSVTYCTTFRLSVEGLRIIHEMYPSLAKRLDIVFKMSRERFESSGMLPGYTTA